jgi:translation initiation factor 1
MATSRLVYSTDSGRVCPACGQPVAHCTCKATAAAQARARQAGSGNADNIVRVQLDTKGRKGKGVTVISGVPLADDALAQLGKQLKAQCGAGGTVKDGVIEVQGDHREVVIAALQKHGYTVKRVGG